MKEEPKVEKEKKERNRLLKDTTFFQVDRDKFPSFLESTKSARGQPMKVTTIEEISIKCYGYGYYQQPGNERQSILKANLISYLEEALAVCSSLKTLKLDFNGFSIDDETLIRIIRLISKFAATRGAKETIEFQTRFLRDCKLGDAKYMLDLGNELVTCNKFEEINMIVSGWQFVQPLTREQLFQLFNDFAGKLAPFPKPNCYLKRLKLDFSSWYMHDLEAYNLLEEFVTKDQLIEKFQSTKIDDRQQNRIEEQHKTILKATITQYLEYLGKKYALENPLPGKEPHYITITKEYEKRKVQQIKKWKSQGKDKMALLKILKDEGSVPSQFKDELKIIYNEVKTDFQAQQKRIQEQEKLIQQVGEDEKEISKVYTKFPFDFVMQERVRGFHNLIRELVQGIYSQLKDLEEFQLDMRNWNRSFQMGELKKSLDKEFSVSGGMKLIGGAISQIVSRIHATPKVGEEQEVQVGLRMSFVM